MSKPVGIEIRNLPSHISRDELIEVFARELGDDNAIRYVLFPLPDDHGKAFICLDHRPDSTFLQRLLEQNPQWKMTLDSRAQAYNCCSAEVNHMIVASLPDVQETKSMLQRDFGVEAIYTEDTGTLTLKGSLMQLHCAQDKLNGIFQEQLILQKIELTQIGRSNSSERGEFSGEERSLEQTDRDYMEDSENRRSKLQVMKGFDDDKRFLESEENQKLEQNMEHNAHRSDTDSSTFARFESRDKRRHDLQSEEPSRQTFMSINFSSSNIDRNPEFAAGDSGPRSLPSAPRKLVQHSPNKQTVEYKSDMVDLKNGVQIRHLNDDRSIESREDRDDSHEFGEDLHRKDDAPDRKLGEVWERQVESVQAHSSESKMLKSNEEPNTGARLRSFATDESRDHRGDHEETARSLPAGSTFSASFSDKRPLTTVNDDDHDRFTSLQFERTEDRFDLPKSPENRPESDENQIPLFLEAHVVKYLMAVERERIKSIRYRFNVDIHFNVEPQSDIATVVFTGRKFSEDSRPQKASEKFVGLYEETFSEIIQRDVLLDHGLPEVRVTIRQIKANIGDRVVLIYDVPGVITVIGEFQVVMRIVDRLNEAKSKVEYNNNNNQRTFHKEHRDLVSTEEIKDEAGRQNTEDANNPGSYRASLNKYVRERQNTGSDHEGEEQNDEKALHSAPADSHASEPSKEASKTPESHSTAVSTNVVSRDVDEPVRDADTAEFSRVTSNSSMVVDSQTGSDQFHYRFKDSFQVLVYSADITKVKVHTIVNAANSFLRNYGGVARAIEDAGGPQLKAACERLYESHGAVEVTDAVHTDASGDLQCKYVIHAVGPTWYSAVDGDKRTVELQDTFKNVLIYADQILKANSLAIPAISTGVFGIPVDACARAIYFSLREFAECQTSVSALKFVHIVNKDPGTTEMILAVFEGLRQLEDEKSAQPPDAANSSEE